jgi:rhodanese-related sulfurtransferase
MWFGPDVPAVSVADLPGDAVLLDVREDEEWAAGHIAEAVHVPMNRVPARVAYDPASLPTDRPIVVVCRMGGRSAAVTAWLAAQGYDARNLDGGMLAWARAGRPMVSESGGSPKIA